MATQLQKRLGIGRVTSQHPVRRAAEKARKAQEAAVKDPKPTPVVVKKAKKKAIKKITPNKTSI